MALRSLGCLLAAAALCASIGCKSKGDTGKPPTLDQRCEQLAKACGDSDKHVDKLADECKQAAKAQTDKGCADKALAAYDCLQKEVCGKADKVWTMDDFRVLADRNGKCADERKALRDCVGP